MSEQTANLCTTDACESLRARLAKYEDAEGRPLQLSLSAEFLEHVKHARKELCRKETAPFHVRQRLAQKLTDCMAAQPSVVDERAAFEAEYRAQCEKNGLPQLPQLKIVAGSKHERYSDDTEQAMWEGWQARAALSAPSHGEQVRQMVPEGFRVMKPTSTVVRDGDRWEIYAPCGSGGIVHEDDVTDWVVRKLLDAAAAPSAGSQEKE